MKKLKRSQFHLATKTILLVIRNEEASNYFQGPHKCPETSLWYTNFNFSYDPQES